MPPDTYKYTITFSAAGLDEASVRELLEAQHNIEECSITRSKAKTGRPPKAAAASIARDFVPAPRFGSTKSVVYAVFEDGHLHKLKDIHRDHPAIAYAYLVRIIRDLHKEGSLRKVEHGLYQAVTAEPPSPREIAFYKEKSRNNPIGSSNQVVLDFLEQPRRPNELKSLLGVSRQRVDQILKMLVKKKLVYRATPDGRSWTYCADMTLLKESVAARALELSGAAQTVLAAMPDAPILLEDLARHLDLNLSTIRRGIEDLEGRNLVELKPFVGRVLLCFTDAGLLSEERGGPKDQAAASDLLSTCGLQRAAIMRILDVMGDLPTRRIRTALRGLYPDEDLAKGLGQIIQRYAKEDLIAIRNVDAAHPDRYLTDNGKGLMDLLRPVLPPLTREQVEKASQVASETETALRKALIVDRRGSVLSERGHEILDILCENGSLTQRIIGQRMTNPHSNRRSLDLSMKALHDKGYVFRRPGERNGEYLWSISVLGRNILMDPMSPQAKAAHLR